MRKSVNAISSPVKFSDKKKLIGYGSQALQRSSALFDLCATCIEVP